MKRTIKSFVLFAACMLLSLNVFAQSGNVVKLKLLDADNGSGLSFATVSLTPKGSDKASKYVLTDDKGAGVIDGVKKGTYTVKAELLGYKPFSQEITVSGALDMGEVKMKPDKEILNAANVSAVGNPIVVKKDTVEYNATSFKTSDNDMLEQLLKKLPGVEVSEDGSVTANGETITKITIDGKTFFLDDPQLATKNIPAKIVQKVKVVEKKSDQAMFTGIDDGEEETVIDLSLRPGMMKGWFGNIQGGGGHDVPSDASAYDDTRYQGAAMIGRFTDKSQLSIILNANNTNNRGFNDMAGTMMRGARGGGGGMGRGQGGWGMRNGITTSWMGGVNGAFTLFDGDMDLSSNYLYNGTSRSVLENSIKNTFLTDGSVLMNDNDGYSLDKTYGNRFGLRLEHKFSENTSILFEPQINFGGGNYSEYSAFTTDKSFNDIINKTNSGFSEETGDNKNVSTSGFFLFRQKLGKDGRTVSANIRYSYSNNELDGFNQSYTASNFDASAGMWEEEEIVNQRIRRDSESKSLSGRVVYTEPIAQNFFVEANYQYSWNESTSTKNAYNSGKDEFFTDKEGDRHLTYVSAGELFDGTYSSDIVNRYINQRIGGNLVYQKEKMRAQAGVSANPTDTYNETNGKTYDSNVVKWAPQAMLFFQFSENSDLRMFYFGRSEQPSTNQLMPVPDNSDPLNVSLGNPYLKPFFNHNMNARFGFSNKKTFTSINANLGGGFVQNPIVNAQWYDAAGARYSIPVNGPASGNFNARLMANSPIAKSNFSVSSTSFVNYSENSSYIGNSTFNNDKYYDYETALFDYEKFHDDYPTLDGSGDFTCNRTQTVSFMERLKLTYRNDVVELTASGRTRYNKSFYTLENANVPATWNNQLNTTMNWTLPWGMNLIYDLDYNWYRGYTTPQPDEVILNAEITQLLIKKKFTLSLKAYDIFAQAKNLTVTDSDTFHQEVRNNTLGRYIILSLTYRFGNFGDKGNSINMGGQGGPMGGGRGPMGGGPMGGGRGPR